MSDVKEIKEIDDSVIYVTLKKPVLVGYLDRHYPFDHDADHNLDHEPCDLLDQCVYPSIEKQVEMFIKCGQKLDVARYQDDMAVDDDDVDDIDELATPFDAVDVSRQDIDAALTSIRSKKQKEPVNKKSVEPQESLPKDDSGSQVVDNNIKKE